MLLATCAEGNIEVFECIIEEACAHGALGLHDGLIDLVLVQTTLKETRYNVAQESVAGPGTQNIIYFYEQAFSFVVFLHSSYELSNRI